jgi:hypothetical protein
VKQALKSSIVKTRLVVPTNLKQFGCCFAEFKGLSNVVVCFFKVKGFVYPIFNEVKG